MTTWTVTLVYRVDIEAESADDAEQIAADNLANGAYSPGFEMLGEITATEQAVTSETVRR